LGISPAGEREVRPSIGGDLDLVVGTSKSWTAKPESRVSDARCRGRLRVPGPAMGGEMREASGTSSVSARRPGPERWSSGAPGMKRGPTTMGKTNSVWPAS
jgi:hypothetical protein